MRGGPTPGPRPLLQGAILVLAALFCVACAADTLSHRSAAPAPRCPSLFPRRISASGWGLLRIRGGASDGPEEEVEEADESSSSSTEESKPEVSSPRVP